MVDAEGFLASPSEYQTPNALAAARQMAAAMMQQHPSQYGGFGPGLNDLTGKIAGAMILRNARQNELGQYQAKANAMPQLGDISGVTAPMAGGPPPGLSGGSGGGPLAGGPSLPSMSPAGGGAGGPLTGGLGSQGLQGSQGASIASRPMDAASLSGALETGSHDPIQGVGNISADTNGSRSYGNFGLNSQQGSSAWRFKQMFGSQLGLTAEPGTPQFDQQWRTVAQTNPRALVQAERMWHSTEVLAPTSRGLQQIGIPPQVAEDPRVQAYFADRSVQQGPASIVNHAGRILQSYQAGGGDPVGFLRAQTQSDLDPRHWTHDFHSAIRSGVYGERGNVARVTGRLDGALGIQPPQQALPQQRPPMGQPPMGQPPMGQPPMGQPPMGQPPMGGGLQAFGQPPQPMAPNGAGVAAATGGGAMPVSMPQGGLPGGGAMPQQGGGMPPQGGAMPVSMPQGGGMPAQGGMPQQRPAAIGNLPQVQDPRSMMPKLPSDASIHALISNPEPGAQEMGKKLFEQKQAAMMPQTLETPTGERVMFNPYMGAYDTGVPTKPVMSEFKRKVGDIEFSSPAALAGNPQQGWHFNQVPVQDGSAAAPQQNGPQGASFQPTGMQGGGLQGGFQNAGGLPPGLTGVGPSGYPLADSSAMGPMATGPTGGAGGMPDMNTASMGEMVNWNNRQKVEQEAKMTSAKAQTEAREAVRGEALKRYATAPQEIQELSLMQHFYQQPHAPGGPLGEWDTKFRSFLNETFGQGAAEGVPASELIKKTNTLLGFKAATALTSRPAYMEVVAALQANPGEKLNDQTSVYLLDILRQQRMQDIQIGRLANDVQDPGDFIRMRDRFYEEHPLVSPFTGQKLQNGGAMKDELDKIWSSNRETRHGVDFGIGNAGDLASGPKTAPGYIGRLATSPGQPGATQPQHSREDIEGEMRRRGLLK